MLRSSLILALLLGLASTAEGQPVPTKKTTPTSKVTTKDTSDTASTTRTTTTVNTSTSATQTQPTLTADQEAAAVAAASGMGILGVVCIAGACLLGLIVYLIPSVVAFSRGHPNAGAICAVNILLGWFFIGWVVALIWSFTAIDVDRRYR